MQEAALFLRREGQSPSGWLLQRQERSHYTEKGEWSIRAHSTIVREEREEQESGDITREKG